MTKAIREANATLGAGADLDVTFDWASLPSDVDATVAARAKGIELLGYIAKTDQAGNNNLAAQIRIGSTPDIRGEGDSSYESVRCDLHSLFVANGDNVTLRCTNGHSAQASVAGTLFYRIVGGGPDDGLDRRHD